MGRGTIDLLERKIRATRNKNETLYREMASTTDQQKLTFKLTRISIFKSGTALTQSFCLAVFLWSMNYVMQKCPYQAVAELWCPPAGKRKFRCLLRGGRLQASDVNTKITVKPSKQIKQRNEYICEWRNKMIRRYLRTKVNTKVNKYEYKNKA